jgi:fermentation-respiration switch protein FrsA (DUF1100 family)
MNRTSFAVFLGVIFVGTLIAVPILGPALTGMFAQTPQGYSQEVIENTQDYVKYRIVYDSHGDDIYALLTIPKRNVRIPAFVIVPAASITKETEQNHLGNELNRLGYATFIIDPRGQGETGGEVPSLTADFFTYKAGGYPTQFKMVDDIFAAYDILSTRNEIDPEGIYAAGESMGGRYAAIAAGLQVNFTGALIISSSGYDFNESGQEPELASFMIAINPETYMPNINKVAFMHGTDDEIIPIGKGRELFGYASGPKEFFEVEGGHSFESMDHDSIDAVIAWLVS